MDSTLKTPTSLLFVVGAVLLLYTHTAPVYAQSGVHITEVMYDAPGNDSGLEWIELTGEGEQSVDIGKYKIFESKKKHPLVVVKGGVQLNPGDSVIVALNPEKFMREYPTYKGTIFKSSFSLSNSGETISLLDASSTPIETTYYSTSMGAKGDGNSLHDSPEGLMSGPPDPGVYSKMTIVSANPSKILVGKKDALVVAQVPTLIKQKLSSGVSSSSAVSNQIPASDVATMAPAIPRASKSFSYLWALLGLVGCSILGVSCVWYAKTTSDILAPHPETTFDPDEFHIV